MTDELLQAIENDDAPKVREIISAGVDLNAENDFSVGEFPLEVACWRGNKEIVELLIENGADVNYADECEFRTALMMASHHGHAEIVRILLKHGANVNAEDDYYATSLTRAAEAGHFEIVRVLLAHGANASVREERDKTAAELAEESGHFEVAEFIRRSAK